MVSISSFIYFAEMCERTISNYHLILSNFHSLNLLLVYVGLVFILIALSQSHRKVEVTHIKKTLTPKQLEEIKAKIRAQANELKAQVELIKSKLMPGQSPEFLSKINEAYSELEIIQSLHNQFKDEIIDSHQKIIEILSGKPETSSIPAENLKSENPLKTPAPEVKIPVKYPENPEEIEEIHNKTRKNSENSEENLKKPSEPKDPEKTPPKEEPKQEEKKESRPTDLKSEVKAEPFKPKIFMPRPGPVSIPRQVPVMRGKVGVSSSSDRAKYSAPAVKSSPFG
jgi:hypothetical protein